MSGTVPYGCGQCVPCRINRQRKWSTRQLLESLTHEESSFVTLTYDEEHMPRDGGLRLRDLQLFLKRLRDGLKPLRVRFYGVGEYGEQTQRPHYHLSLFGLCGHSVVPYCGKPMVGTDIVERAWGQGFVQVGDFNRHTAGYVCSYIVKGWVRKDHNALAGRFPEFARMSRRPGLGFEAAKVVASSLVGSGHGMSLLERGDVPAELKMGNRSIPMDRYLLLKLRELVGYQPDYIAEVKARKLYESSVEMSAMLIAALAESPLASPKQAYVRHNEGALASREARAKIGSMKKRAGL